MLISLRNKSAKKHLLIEENLRLHEQIKMLEEKLAIHQNNYTFDLLNNTSIAAVLIGTDEQILEVNNEYASRFGKTREEMLNTNAYKAYPPEVAEIRRQTYKKVVESGENFKFTDERDGFWNLHHMCPIKDSNGVVKCIAIYGLNITDQRKAELELKKSEELFNTTVNSLNDIIFVIDTDYKIVLVNHTFITRNAKDGFGGDVIGENIFEVYPFLSEKIHNEYEKVFSTGLISITFEEVMVSGNKVYTESRRIPIVDNGKTVRIVTAIRDISNLKNSENELRESLATKDKFLSIIAHDLINPITSVRNVAGLLKDEFENFPKEKQLRLITAIHESLIGTSNLLDDLLTWSLSQQNQFSFNPVEISVLEMLESASAFFSNAALNKEIQVKIIHNETIQVTVEVEMISTVLRNLISNALKFTNRGGTIEIGYKRIKPGYVEIFISDDGIGISQKNIEKLLQLGENISTPGTEKEKGTGFGIILCKDFLKLHNSKLDITSQENKGSRFSFILKEVVI
jgi:PAS domain S-box-containing protein